MKTLKTAIIIIAIVLVLSVILYFLPLDKIFQRIPLVGNFYANTTLEIVTPNGKANILIDDKEYGDTPNNIIDLVEGEYKLTLRKEENETFYTPHTFDITLTKNTTTRVNIEIGPDENISGTILYYTPSIFSSKGKITITSNVEDSRVNLNKEYLKNTPVSELELDEGEYEITISKDNYESVTVPIIVRSGYTLNIKAYLLPIPITINEYK